MDAKKFDELIARLANGPSRRDALKGLAGGTLAAVGVPSLVSSKNKKGKDGGDGRKNKKKARAQGGKKAKAEACIPTGKKCPSPKPRGKKGKKLGCNKCCQRYVDTSGPKNKCACTPDGVACVRDAHCCSANCVGGVCQVESSSATTTPTSSTSTTQTSTSTSSTTQTSTSTSSTTQTSTSTSSTTQTSTSSTTSTTTTLPLPPLP